MVAVVTRVYVQVVNKYIIWRISDARAAGEARDAGVMVAHAGQPPLPDGMLLVTAHLLSPPAPKWAEETSTMLGTFLRANSFHLVHLTGGTALQHALYRVESSRKLYLYSYPTFCHVYVMPSHRPRLLPQLSSPLPRARTQHLRPQQSAPQ